MPRLGPAFLLAGDVVAVTEPMPIDPKDVWVVVALGSEGGGRLAGGSAGVAELAA